MRSVFVCLCALFLLVSVADAPSHPALTLMVRPLFLITRGDIRVEVRVTPNTENRFLVISWTSDEGSTGETLRQIDGDDGPVLHVLTLSSQPPANYLFIATLIGRNGVQRGQAEARVRAAA